MMKMTKFLATLLCIMMVVCAVPVMQVSANETSMVEPGAGLDTSNIIWEDDFNDGNKDGWTDWASGYAAFDVVDGVLHANSEEMAVQTKFQSDVFDGLESQSFNFRFKMMLSDTGYVGLTPTFGETKMSGCNLGYAPAGLSMDGDTWYEWMFVYKYDKSTETMIADIWCRKEKDSSWSDWTKMITKDVNTTGGNGQFILLFGKPNGTTQFATDVWFDDFVVYTDVQEGIDMSQVGYVWSDDFADGNKTGWTDFAPESSSEFVVKDGMLHGNNETLPAEIKFQSDVFDGLEEESFAFRFKMLLDDVGYVSLYPGFGESNVSRCNIGYAAAGFSMEADTWYEWMYTYKYDEAETTLTADIYYRKQVDSVWSDWEYAKTVSAATTGGSSQFRLLFPQANGVAQCANNVWFDDFMVYTNVGTPKSLTAIDGVTATYNRNLETTIICVTGAPEGTEMFVAEYGVNTLENVSKIAGNDGKYEFYLPTENPYKIFFWDGNLSPIFNAISN